MCHFLKIDSFNVKKPEGNTSKSVKNHSAVPKQPLRHNPFFGIFKRLSSP